METIKYKGSYREIPEEVTFKGSVDLLLSIKKYSIRISRGMAVEILKYFGLDERALPGMGQELCVFGRWERIIRNESGLFYLINQNISVI